jgi:hypothetical protein
MDTNTQTKPSLVMVIALMTLVNGIFNVIWGIGIITGTAGIGLLCFGIPLFPIVLGGFEIAYATKLLANPPQPVQPSQAIAIWEIVAVLTLNFLSMVVGILVLVFYNDSTVREYFSKLNGTPVPAPVPVTEPPLPADPIPAPVPPAESLPTPPAPLEPESPEKPKRRPRKVA